jgi:hypothetical protein
MCEHCVFFLPAFIRIFGWAQNSQAWFLFREFMENSARRAADRPPGVIGMLVFVRVRPPSLFARIRTTRFLR